LIIKVLNYRSPLKYVPQVKSDSAVSNKYYWTQITGIYKAQGGEKFITLGNYDKYKYFTKKLVDDDYGRSSYTSYYYLDDVSVTEITKEFKELKPEQTIQIGNGEVKLLPKIGDKFNLEGIQFKPNQYKILDSSFVKLDKLVELLKINPFLKIEIVGHTDSLGNAVSNLRLSENRANAVLLYLKDKGISENRIKSSGKGSDEPIAPNTTSEGRALNRRIEIIIIDVFSITPN
jgi:outer membrane protein OmpA-like peptidoglycan-associated protein